MVLLERMQATSHSHAILWIGDLGCGNRSSKGWSVAYLASLGLGDKVVDLVGMLRAHHDIHLGNSPKQLLAFLLRHTARHHDLNIVEVLPFSLRLPA